MEKKVLTFTENRERNMTCTTSLVKKSYHVTNR